MRELRIHGRGGQGAVIASKVLAVALFREGSWVQSFPAFGVERRGAPVTAFLRVADRPVRLRCEVAAPDDLIVLDPTLIGAIDVTAGLKPGGGILINSDHAPEHYADLCGRYRVATVDASGIAAAHGIGSRTQPIVNTAILGAFASWSAERAPFVVSWTSAPPAVLAVIARGAATSGRPLSTAAVPGAGAASPSRSGAGPE